MAILKTQYFFPFYIRIPIIKTQKLEIPLCGDIESSASTEWKLGFLLGADPLSLSL